MANGQRTKVEAKATRSGRRFAPHQALRAMCLVLTALICSLVFASIAVAQSDDVPPPPLKMMSKSEKAELAAKTEPKERVNLALQFMETRLKSAEKDRADENYSVMYAELGGFDAIMDSTLEYLLHANANEGRRLNSLKRFEIGLREFVPRIEGIRRDSPLNFDPYLKTLLKYISDAREKAIAPFFSNTVVQ